MTDSTDRDDDDAPESDKPEAESAKAEAAKPKADAVKSKADAVKPKAKAARGGVAKAPPAKSAGVPAGSVGLLLAVALAAGVAGGWFGHTAQAKAASERADAAPAGSAGSSEGPCGAWEAKICASSGKESASCQQAQMARDLLTPSSCQAALNAVPATLAKIKAARSSCDNLVKKLCGDLKPESPTCAMVKERTPSFPPKRCEEMLGNYDAVIAELRQMEALGGPPTGGPGAPHGMPPGTPMPTMPADGQGH
jgi:hypothetical protein